MYFSASAPLISLSKLLSIDYSSEDIHRISVRLSNAYLHFCKNAGLEDNYSALEDYVRYHFNCIKLRKTSKTSVSVNLEYPLKRGKYRLTTYLGMRKSMYCSWPFLPIPLR